MHLNRKVHFTVATSTVLQYDSLLLNLNHCREVSLAYYMEVFQSQHKD